MPYIKRHTQHYKEQCKKRGIDLKDADDVALKPNFVLTQQNRSTFKYIKQNPNYKYPLIVPVSASGHNALIPKTAYQERNSLKLFNNT